MGCTIPWARHPGPGILTYVRTEKASGAQVNKDVFILLSLDMEVMWLAAGAPALTKKNNGL